jgi:hypothetical protein
MEQKMGLCREREEIDDKWKRNQILKFIPSFASKLIKLGGL